MVAEVKIQEQEVSYKVVDVADNDTQVTANPAFLYGVYVNTVLSAHVVPIKDGGTTGTTVVSLPASAAAGSTYDFPGIYFKTDIHVDPNDLATGSITVAYRDA